MTMFFAVIASVLFSVPSFAGPLKLICRDAGQQYRLGTQTYEKVTVTTPNGPKFIYALTDVTYTHSFVAAKVAAGDKGQNLKSGECGLAQTVLQGTSPNPASPPTLKYRNFNMYHMGTYTFSAPGSNGPTTVMSGQMFLPSCPNGAHQFAAQQLPNTNMFEVVGDASVVCLK